MTLPCSNLTKIVFGGDDLCMAYVTSAWKGLSHQARVGQPLAGGLFSFRTTMPGCHNIHSVILASLGLVEIVRVILTTDGDQTTLAQLNIVSAVNPKVYVC